MVKYKPTWHIRHIRDGKVIWEDEILENILHDEGEEYILQCAFSEEVVPPVDFYFGLYDVDPTMAEGDALATHSGDELSGSAYARQPIPSTAVGWTVTQDAGDYEAQSTDETFTASGGAWAAARFLFLATTVDNTGKLIASAQLSADRTLQDGDSLQVSMDIKLSE